MAAAAGVALLVPDPRVGPPDARGRRPGPRPPRAAAGRAARPRRGGQRCARRRRSGGGGCCWMTASRSGSGSTAPAPPRAGPPPAGRGTRSGSCPSPPAHRSMRSSWWSPARGEADRPGRARPGCGAGRRRPRRRDWERLGATGPEGGRGRARVRAGPLRPTGWSRRSRPPRSRARSAAPAARPGHASAAARPRTGAASRWSRSGSWWIRPPGGLLRVRRAEPAHPAWDDRRGDLGDQVAQGIRHRVEALGAEASSRQVRSRRAMRSLPCLAASSPLAVRWTSRARRSAGSSTSSAYPRVTRCWTSWLRACLVTYHPRPARSSGRRRAGSW